VLGSVSGFGQSANNQPAVSNPGVAVGTVKAVSGNLVTLATDSGSEVKVTVPAETRIQRTAPGRKDLKDATAAQLADVQAGDRLLVRAQPGADSSSVTAASIVLMKQTDIASEQEKERQDWQRRGVAGLVSAVDPAAATVTISNLGFAGKTNIVIHVNKDTVIRRYASNSVRFDDAKPGVFSDIKAGDQLRARGNRSADGKELTAEGIVSGRFRNIAGTVVSTDPATNTITLKDLATKTPVAVKVSSDSQLRKLPPTMAQMIARRLHPEAAGASQGNGGNFPGGAGAMAARRPGGSEGGGPRGGMQGGGPGGPSAGGGDFQQMLARMPAVTLAELQKGDALMIVATEGNTAAAPGVITLLAGVEPILTAAPNGGAAALLSQWNLGGGMGEMGQMGGQ
jgi:hypothetical protein